MKLYQVLIVVPMLAITVIVLSVLWPRERQTEPPPRLINITLATPEGKAITSTSVPSTAQNWRAIADGRPMTRTDGKRIFVQAPVIVYEEVDPQAPAQQLPPEKGAK